MASNQDILQKNLTTARFFAGGELNPEQQDRFIQVIREFGGFLKDVSMVRTSHGKMDIDKVYVGEPITEAASEVQCSPTYHSPKFNKVSIEVAKMRAAYMVSTEALQVNIEKAGFDDTLISMMAAAHAQDVETLAIQGDSSIVLATAGDTPMNRLLSIKDGWDKITDSANILDVAGNAINKNIFHAAWNAMPRHYKRNTANLRWIMNRSTWADYINLIAERPTSGGDAALMDGSGMNFRPMGISPLFVDTIPDFKALTSASATPAVIIGDRADPFEIRSSGATPNNRLEIDVNNAGPVVVTFAEGVYTANEIAYFINNTVGLAGIASVDQDGHVVLTSPTSGAASEIELVTTTHGATSSRTYLTLGFVPNSTVPAAYPFTVNGAASGDDTHDGTFIWLADPKQFLWAVLDETRVFAEYNKDCDQIETVIYDQMDFKVQNLDAIVKVTNIKRRV